MRQIFLPVLIVFILLQIPLVLTVEPFGATITPGTSQRAQEDSPGTVDAIAGNVTELNVFGYSITQSWQGYFGNVTGTIQLADASDNVLYNWSLASPEGEIYASVNNTIDWANIACFSYGNHSALEAEYGISSDDVDGVNETFATGNGHDQFYTNNILFTVGECMSTQVYDSSGTGVDNNFEEVLLTDGSSNTNVIFTSILDEEDVKGFNNVDHDFEMLVLENGHGTDTSTTTYYFWVELE